MLAEAAGAPKTGPLALSKQVTNNFATISTQISPGHREVLSKKPQFLGFRPNCHNFDTSLPLGSQLDEQNLRADRGQLEQFDDMFVVKSDTPV